MNRDLVQTECNLDQRSREAEPVGRWKRTVFASVFAAGIGVVITSSYLVGARVGFDQGREQAILSQQELKIRQVLFAQWAMYHNDLNEATDRMNRLLELYLKDRVELFEKEPFWLAPHLFGAYPLHAHIPGQTDAMIYDHLTKYRKEYERTSPAEHSASRVLIEETFNRYVRKFDAILAHTAAQYDAVQKRDLATSESPHQLLLHDDVDGPISHRINYQNGIVALRFLGDASIGKGGVLWARFQVSDGSTGYIAIDSDVGVFCPRIPFWRRWLAALPGY